MSLELNKIAAAVLTAGVVAMGTGFVADLLVKPHPPEVQGRAQGRHGRRRVRRRRIRR
jgi:hypothetical protein